MSSFPHLLPCPTAFAPSLYASPHSFAFPNIGGLEEGLSASGAALPDLDVDNLSLKIARLNGLSRTLAEKLGYASFHMRKSLLEADLARKNAYGDTSDVDWYPDMQKVPDRMRGSTNYWPSKGIFESAFL